MRVRCPYCHPKETLSELRTYVRTGHYRRRSDGRIIQRYRCKFCFKYFSNATFNPCYRQKKRHFNHRLFVLMNSGISRRRLAKIFHLSRTTVDRKFKFLGAESLRQLEETNKEHPSSEIVEFDDLETFEHTKCKPLSVTLAVQNKTRRILGFQVSKMPAKGHLTRLALKKYGRRNDERSTGRKILFQRIKPLVHENALLKSDQNSHYIEDVKRFFPFAHHISYKGQRGSITGQGELKKVRFDPLFSLNHTCAMLRANMNRLFRKTWCTTKKAESLTLHLAMYAYYHNSQLINSS